MPTGFSDVDLTKLYNPYSIGDIIWHDFAQVTTMTLTSTLIVTGVQKDANKVAKGEILKTGNDGKLQRPGYDGKIGCVDVSQGVYQALHDADEGEKLQVMGMGSRVILKSAASVEIGNMVKLVGNSGPAVDTTKVDFMIKTHSQDITQPGTGTVSVQMPFDYASLGRVFQILTRTSGGAEKLVTANDDLVVVELGMK